MVTLLGSSMSYASYLQVDILPTTSNAYTLPDLNLGNISTPPQLTILPFYFRLNFPANNNMNWGIELYSNNRRVMSGTTSDGIYRGLRSGVDPNNSLPLYWQVYDFDWDISDTYGTPQSVTSTVGGLGFYQYTLLPYWGPLYDISDLDLSGVWDSDSRRSERLVVSVDGLGRYPNTGRTQNNPPVYIYFGGDLRPNNNQQYVGMLTIDLFSSPFDFNYGCYVTPNPFRPVLGERAYFNFYTNYPDSRIIIKIYDPTGFPVVTLENTRYWDGRNSNHQYVEGGLYLYQIETEGHLISGTVVVIK
jgi:hypothetical protein